MTSFCAGARVTAILSTRCHGDDIGFRPNVTSLSSSEIDKAGNEKMASAESRPTHAVLAVISQTCRQCHSDVRDHESVNTNQIQSEAVSHAQSAFNYQTSDDTLSVHHQQQQLQQQTNDGATDRTQSAWNRRDNRRDMCHSLKVTSPSTSSPSSSSSSNRRVTVTSRQRAERRRAATERERHRLRRVNAAFDLLREHTCRHVISDVTSRSLRAHRLSKLNTLRRAISYIEHLEHLLNNNVHISQTCMYNLQKTVNVVSYFTSVSSLTVFRQ